ncbi:MAG: helix-turn-helix transcriptional regulator [Lentisphaeria bacterium]|nr:helix-turn-helix transcriptional regulator [Lentisphaeria bacterium]
MSEHVKYISKNVKLNINERFLPQIELCNCGQVVLKEWMVPMRSLPLWHVYRNSAPGGVLVLPDRKIDMKPETVYLLPPYLVFATASHGIFEHVHLDFSMKSSLFSRVRKEVLEFPFRTFRPLLENCFRDRFSALAGGALIYSLLNAIEAEYFTEEGYFPIDPRIQHALDLISAAFQSGKLTGLDNRSISRKIGMSPVNFQHLFKREMKMPPHRYILNRRLELAHDLLRNSNMNIEDIAEATAFVNRYQFTKSFSRLYGMAPGRFRRG